MRYLFIQNIPYIRGLDIETIRPLAYLMKPQVFDQGDFILQCGEKNRSIYIVWEGDVQVRVSRRDPSKLTQRDIWFDNLEKGTCFEVFNAIDDNSQTLLDYVANSRFTVLYKIDRDDLDREAQNCLVLKNRLQIVRLRIKNKEVGDLDYFKFPKRYLDCAFLDQTDEDHQMLRHKQVIAKRRMISCMLRFIRNFRQGRVIFPWALETLDLIRKDRRINVHVDSYLY